MDDVLSLTLLCEKAYECHLISILNSIFYFHILAMVAFTKLLMFCVIEMKYMVMIMQTRLNAAGTNLSTDELRKREAAMHSRFYFILSSVLLDFGM